MLSEPLALSTWIRKEALKVPANQAAAQMDSDLKACFQLFFYTAPSWLWDAGIIPKQ
jgi:hypothetical protein